MRLDEEAPLVSRVAVRTPARLLDRASALIYALIFVAAVGQTAIVPLLPAVQQRYGLDNAALAWLMTMPNLAMFISATPLGNPRRPPEQPPRCLRRRRGDSPCSLRPGHPVTHGPDYRAARIGRGHRSPVHNGASLAGADARHQLLAEDGRHGYGIRGGHCDRSDSLREASERFRLRRPFCRRRRGHHDDRGPARGPKCRRWLTR